MKIDAAGKKTNRWTFWWRDFGKVKVWTETHMSHLHWSVGRRMWSTFPRCDLWLLWELTLQALRGLYHGTVISLGLSKVEADKRDVFWEGLWRCLAFFTAAVKVLHSIHCEAPPQNSLQKSKHKVGMAFLCKERIFLVGLCALLGNVWKLKMYIQGLAPSWISRKHWWRQPPLKCQLNMICKLGLTHVCDQPSAALWVHMCYNCQSLERAYDQAMRPVENLQNCRKYANCTGRGSAVHTFNSGG